MKFRKILLSLSMLAIVSIPTIPVHAASTVDISTPVIEQESEQNTTRGAICTFYCTGNNVNVRKGPGTKYGVITQINKGQFGELYEYSSDYKWAYVWFNNGESTTGWVSVAYLDLREP